MHTLRRHMHRQAGANCTDATLYFWTIFQFFFFYPNGTWTHPPTSKLFLDFWNFFNFAKPLTVSRISYFPKVPFDTLKATRECINVIISRFLVHHIFAHFVYIILNCSLN